MPHFVHLAAATAALAHHLVPSHGFASLFVHHHHHTTLAKILDDFFGQFLFVHRARNRCGGSDRSFHFPHVMHHMTVIFFSLEMVGSFAEASVGYRSTSEVFSGNRRQDGNVQCEHEGENSSYHR